MKWERNNSTGSHIGQVTPNGRIIRNGLYRAEFWGDYSLKFPIKGQWRKSLKVALADLKKLSGEP